MKKIKIPWHHMDSDYEPHDLRSPRKWSFKIVKEAPPTTIKVEYVVKEFKRADLNDDPFLFGNKPFENK
jgi:hypothetical protein